MNGFLNIIKPTGMTSNDLVAKLRGRIRKAYGIKLKVGHTGTLDPNAAGVMILAFGKSSKFAQYLIEKEKSYVAEILFGKNTDTLDTYGKVLDETDIIPFDENKIRKVLDSFIGESYQVPPMYSAIKVAGQKLYKMARNGQSIEVEPRKIFIDSIVLLDIKNDRILIDVSCSSGTYIRSLAKDIAEKTGNVGTLSLLVRNRVDRHKIEDSYTLEEVENFIDEKLFEKILLNTEDILPYKELILSENGEKLYKNGASIKLKRYSKQSAKEGIYKVYCKNIFLGLGEVKKNEDFYLKSKTLLGEV